MKQRENFLSLIACLEKLYFSELIRSMEHIEKFQ